MSPAIPEARPAVEGWFRSDPAPALLASRCTTCDSVFFPPLPGHQGFCRNPVCGGESFEEAALSGRGVVWSYTDARYQPPPPYLPPSEEHQPFALAAVELPEGIVVLGQVADGYGVADLRVGSEVDLVVQPLYRDDEGERTIWRWRPTGDGGRA